MKNQDPLGDFAALLQRFFCERLINQQNVSSRTVAAYRDTFRLFLKFIQERTHLWPSELTFQMVDTESVLAFLRYLEEKRGNCVRTRNARLAALRAFFHYVSVNSPACLPLAQRVLSIPMKRFDRPLMGFLSREEIDAITNAPDSTTWSGRRDRVMFVTLYNTGARVSELITLKLKDICFQRNASVTIYGKGRKQRTVPLWKSTARSLRSWIKEITDDPEAPLFPDSNGRFLSRSGVEHRLRRAVGIAAHTCPSLRGHRISPHTVRHTTAMHLLQSGVDITVIALWLGHESLQTTHMYVEANLAMKERALARLQEPSMKALRYRAPDSLLEFLKSL